MSKKQVIAVDIDDVLAQHAEAFIEFSNQRYGTKLTKQQYDDQWGKLWHVTRDEIERRALEFQNIESILAFGKVEEAEPVLKKLARRYELVIVTARPKHIIEVTHTWLEQQFPAIFSGAHFVPIWDPYNKLTKADICMQIGADYLIDDLTRHCNLAAQSGITALLFGDYGWNRGEVEPSVIRVRDWPAVLEYFDGLER